MSTIYFEPWKCVEHHASNLERELEREVSEGHPLYRLSVSAIAQRIDTDDVLFSINGSSAVAVVRLTWSGASENDAMWPSTIMFHSLDDWLRNCMQDESKMYDTTD